ncbi:MAG: hypothetical protein CM1200mP25_2950 [Acidobacteriota bacterium]|nr:MAG: hypothetical protein CM1200mP25_2950 [Acidobacteriota bacterium]
MSCGTVAPTSRLRVCSNLAQGPLRVCGRPMHVFRVSGATHIETDHDTVELGQQLLRDTRMSDTVTSTWHASDIVEMPSFEGHDLVLMAYVLGEFLKMIVAQPFLLHGKRREKRSSLLNQGRRVDPREFSMPVPGLLTRVESLLLPVRIRWHVHCQRPIGVTSQRG